MIACINCENLETFGVLFSQNSGTSFALLVHYLGTTCALLDSYVLHGEDLGTAWALLGDYLANSALVGHYLVTTSALHN